MRKNRNRTPAIIQMVMSTVSTPFPEYSLHFTLIVINVIDRGPDLYDVLTINLSTMQPLGIKRKETVSLLSVGIFVDSLFT